MTQTRGPSHPRRQSSANPLALVVVALVILVYCWLVHCWPALARDSAGEKPLPVPVAEMRDLILAAVHSGRIEDLRAALDVNGVKPDFGADNGADPIAALKALSGDGKGAEILAALGEILDMPPAALPLGRDLENNLIYVWPYLAEKPLDQFAAPEDVDLYRLVSPAKAKEMREKKRWTWWRLTIGADGTWQAFKKPE